MRRRSGAGMADSARGCDTDLTDEQLALAEPFVRAAYGEPGAVPQGQPADHPGRPDLPEPDRPPVAADPPRLPQLAHRTIPRRSLAGGRRLGAAERGAERAG